MGRPDAIEMRNAELHSQVRVKRFLKRRAWSLGSGGTFVFEPLENGLTHFGTVPMPSILQGRFPSYAVLLEPAIRC
jgi:hypothetical protein